MNPQHDISGHHDILDEQEGFGLSFVGSLLFHGGLLGIVLVAGWVERSNRLLLGEPHRGRIGSEVENEIYTPAGQRANSPQYQTPGAGGVGVGTNSPFGNQFGYYADLLRQQVGRNWKTADIDPRIRTAPQVVVTFTLRRDGTATSVNVTQKSGISALDVSAQRAIYDASPFPKLPDQFRKNEAWMAIVFEV